ncbi:MAG: ABC transporter ATP-binding protein [Hyphomicrobiales bacterium]
MSDADYIRIEGVWRHYGAVKAVDDVSFSIARGEFFSLLGPSGCGKTTLLRLLAGLDAPTSGAIFIDGQDMSRVPANRRPTNMVFQSYAIFPHLNVYQNIAYGLGNRGLDKEAIHRKVEDALDLIRLKGYGERRAHELSGGQRQRVALARALVCDPKVLLLDEPLGALDKKLREEMQVELRKLQRTVGITFVFVTHDQEEALALSDRVAVMGGGRVLQIDTAARLYEYPVSKTVAAFIGSMNFIPATLIGNGKADAGPLGPLLVEPQTLPVGTPVTLAIRPEKLAISGERPAGAINAVRGTVMAATYMGDRSQYHVGVAEIADPLIVSVQNNQRQEGLAREGTTLWVSWAPAEAAVLRE